MYPREEVLLNVISPAVIFASLQRITADTYEYKDQGNALTNTSYIRKNTKFSLDAKVVSVLILKKSFNDPLLICENLHWRQTLEK